MHSPTVERQQLIEAVKKLPDEVLVELADFLDYLNYKSLQPRVTNRNQSDFLASITGLGESGHQDISGRDEEILHAETDPIQGWTINPSNPA